MSANAPAVRGDPFVDRFVRIGEWLAAVETGDQSAQTKHKAAALRLYLATELGLPPLAAAELSVIRGNLVVSAKLLRGLASKAGYRVIRIDGDENSCTAAIIDRESGEEIGRTTFTMDDAKRAKLVRDKSGYQTHPARMLWARASKFAVDDFAPEVSLGLVTEEEAEEIEEGGQMGDVAGSGSPSSTSPVGSPAAGEDLSDVEEADWRSIADEAEAEQDRQRANAQHFAEIGRLDQDASTRAQLPKEFDSWDAWSSWRAKGLWGVESRAELDAEQLRRLTEEIRKESVPFG